MAGSNTGRGFQNMSAEKQRKIAEKGGEASSSKQDMSELGKKGAAAKRRSGEQSRQNS